MLCAPRLNVETANVAAPLVSVTVATVVPPSLNVAVPVAVPDPGAAARTVAVMLLCVPTDRFERASVATPLPFNVTGEPAVPSTVNVTVPVGVPDPGETAVTVAVNVTNWPKTDGFTDEVSAVAELALLTVCDSALEVEVRKFESPLYRSEERRVGKKGRSRRARVPSTMTFK